MKFSSPFLTAMHDHSRDVPTCIRSRARCRTYQHARVHKHLCILAYAQLHTHTHVLTHTLVHATAYMHTHRHKYKFMHMCTQPHKRLCIDTHYVTYAHILMQSHACTLTHTHMLARANACTLLHVFAAHSCMHTRTCTHATPTNALPLANAHSDAHYRPHILVHTYARRLASAHSTCTLVQADLRTYSCARTLVNTRSRMRVHAFMLVYAYLCMRS